jgi:hypothetical protein
LAPQLSFALGERTVLALYFGPSFRLGLEEPTEKLISQTLIDTVRHGFPFLDEDENKADLLALTTLNAGVSIYYRFLVFDLRSKYNRYYGVFLQVGLAL